MLYCCSQYFKAKPREETMKIKHLLLSTLVTVSLSTVVRAEDYILATASTGGTYYPVGVALSTLTKIKLEPKEKISMSAINSAGSGENVRLLRENEAQFAILQGLFGYYAATGTGPVASAGKQENLRSVTMLWQNVEHFVVDKDNAKTGTVADLISMKGENMGMGKKNSGTIGSNKTLLAGLGIDIDKDYRLFYAGYGPTADALQNGQIQGFGIPAGAPAGAITKLLAADADAVKVLDITDEQLKQMDAGKGLWTRHVIKAETYPNQSKDINTIAQPNFLAVNADVSADDVYKITKTIYENLAFLNGIHKATKAMAIEKAIAGLPLPLHPGAAKYYQEVGINIPDNLITK